MKKNMKPKLRPLGKITDDLEPLLLEMGVEHQLQWHEIIGIIHAYLQVHLPNSQEVYTKDGSSPVYSYAPKKERK